MEEFQSRILRNQLLNIADFQVTEKPPEEETLKDCMNSSNLKIKV